MSTASATALPPSYRLALRHVHAGELADERLVLEEHLQVALARLGLVGRVGGVELAARRDAVDDGRDEVVVAAAAQEADLLPGRPILAGQRRHVLRQLQLGQRRRQMQRSLQPRIRRDLREQLLDAPNADRFEHRRWSSGVLRIYDIGLRQRDVTPLVRFFGTLLLIRRVVHQFLETPTRSSAEP